MPSKPKIMPKNMMKISYIITIQLMVCLLSFKWNMQGQINDKKQPVKLPINPIKMVKWGTTTAIKIVKTTTPTRNPSPKVIYPNSYEHWPSFFLLHFFSPNKLKIPPIFTYFSPNKLKKNSNLQFFFGNPVVFGTSEL